MIHNLIAFWFLAFNRCKHQITWFTSSVEICIPFTLHFGGKLWCALSMEKLERVEKKMVWVVD